MIQVIFTYDEKSNLWIPTVAGTNNEVEARQGFSAVVLTCQMLNPDLLIHTKVVGRNMTIIPAV